MISELFLFVVDLEQYSLGNDQSAGAQLAIEQAIRDGSKWVLKPQREGGGNNYYGAELSAFLAENKLNPILGGMRFALVLLAYLLLDLPLLQASF